MKFKCYILTLLFLSCGIALFATDHYNVGIIHYSAEIDEHTIELPLDSLIPYFDTVKAHKERKDSITYRNNKKLELLRAIDVDKALKEGKQVPSSSIEPSIIEDTVFKVNYTQLKMNEVIPFASLSSDPILRNHFFLTYDLDELIVISLTPFDTLYRVTVDSYRALTTRERITDMLLPELSKKEYEKVLLRSFMNIFDKKEYALISLSSFIPSLMVSVNDGEFKEIEYLLTDEEKVSLTYKAPNYTTRTQEINIDDTPILDIGVTLEKNKGLPLLIRSSDEVDVQVSQIGSVSLPFLYSSVTFPFTISATKKGYSASNIIVTSPIDVIDIQLQQEHLSYRKVIPRVQDAFYASLFRTVIVGASSILISSLLPSSEIDGIQPIHSLFHGVTIVSSIETLFRLFDYYEKSKYSIKK